MKYSVLEAVGNTPVIELKKVSAETSGVRVCAKRRLTRQCPCIEKTKPLEERKHYE